MAEACGSPDGKYFNSQPHKEADGISSSLLYPSQYFNSQPHKEADHSIKNGFYRHRHFNSQPHKEADGNRAYMPMYHAEISTHSLTRRLTLLLRETLRFYYISTHSLTRRLTVNSPDVKFEPAFQLTASQGG